MASGQSKKGFINMSRDDNVKIFKDTMYLCETNEKLIASIRNSKEGQAVVLGIDDISVSEHGKYDAPAKIVVSKKRSLEAASGYPDNQVCVLNFASATNAGGGVVNGSNAQEEAICRCSTLYPCISDEMIVSQFHNKHREALKAGKMSALYNDDCIYTPRVSVFKTDTANPELMPEDKWFEVDVISCAAPNLRSKPSNAMNPNSGNKAVVLKPDELLELHMKRMRRILDLARSNGAEIVILGAFGCGAFQNPSDVVAEAMARVIKDYRYDFKAIEFAVYCSPRDTKNYDTFNRRLGRM